MDWIGEHYILMAHFAKLDGNNIVTQVIVVHDWDAPSEAGGIEFLTQWSGGYSNWKQTSYNGNIRKNYAGVGYTYDSERDAFIPPKPYPSWILDEATCRWFAPTPCPVDLINPQWDEDTLTWKEFIWPSQS